MKSICFNKAMKFGSELDYITQAVLSQKLSGDSPFGLKSQTWLQEKLLVKKALLTPSCTHALEMAALLANIEPGDEVIMPSFTFVSTANAFLLRGAKIVFVDIKPDDMNIDEALIERAITSKTKAIVVVHYAGAPCEMDAVMTVAKQYKLLVIEDAAQAILTKYKNKYLGTIGDLAAFSFHETKNIQCGEGGALLINNPEFLERSEVLREKGTNRSKFLRGQIDKYTWVDLGSSYLPSEICSAYLFAQLEKSEQIISNRFSIWSKYKNYFDNAKIDIPYMKNTDHNGHIFWLKCKDIEERTRLIQFLKEKGVHATFHYVPLHSTEFGRKHSRFVGEDVFTTQESERLVRLPLWNGLSDEDQTYICEKVSEFYS